MDPITGFVTVPNTLVPISSTNMVTAASTATVTKTLTKTLTDTLAKTVHAACNASKPAITIKGAMNPTTTIKSMPSLPAHFSDVPTRLLNQVAHLYTSVPRSKAFTKLAHMAPALKTVLAATVAAGGVMFLSNKLLKIAREPPTGEGERSWSRKLKYAYNFLKTSANENEQLRKDILEAHQDRDRALQERDQAKKDAEHLDDAFVYLQTESNMFDREMYVMQRQTRMDQEEITGFRVDNISLKHELARRHGQTNQLLQAKKNSADAIQQLSEVQAEKDALVKELDAALQHPAELQKQVGQLLQEKNAIIDELREAKEEPVELRERLSTAREHNEDLRDQLQSALQHPVELQKQVEQLLQEKNAVLEELHETKGEPVELRELLSTARQHNEELQQQLESAQTQQQDFTKLENQLEQVKKDAAHEVEQLRAELEGMRKHTDELQQSLDAKETELKTYDDSKNAELESLIQESKELEDDMKLYHENELQDEIKTRVELQKKHAELQEKLDDETRRRNDVDQELTHTRIQWQNKVDDEIRRRNDVDQELTRTKDQLLQARSQNLQTCRQPGLFHYTDLTPSRSAVARRQPGSARSMPSTVRKSGLNASPPALSLSFSQDPAPETLSAQTKQEAAVTSPIEQETSVTPVSSSPLSVTVRSDSTPSRKRGHDANDDDTPGVVKRIKEEETSETELMELAEYKLARKVILDLDNLPDFSRPSAPAPAPTPVTARRSSSRIPTAAAPTPGRRSTRNAGKLPSLNERDLSQRAMSPSKPPAPRSPTRRQASPSKAPPKTGEPSIARQTRSQSPKKR
jgi:hypothetical protein